MSDHVAAEAHGHAAGGHPSGDGLRFEKSELQYFIDDDQDAGRNIGKLLGATFFILVFLMTGVAWWTNRHQSVSHDPHDVPVASQAAAGH